MVRSYHRVPIDECHEPLVPLVAELACLQPHPYQALGAPYGSRSPNWLRAGVVQRLEIAQQWLAEQQSGWQLALYDAYRPVAVQAFMVEQTLRELAAQEGLDPVRDGRWPVGDHREQLLPQVLQFWSPPNSDPAMPPPHSTGAAVDLTLRTADGCLADMGSPIDELSPRSYPQAFVDQPEIQARRDCLRSAMLAAGFYPHPQEWWHFSYGDQMWAEAKTTTAMYGRVD